MDQLCLLISPSFLHLLHHQDDSLVLSIRGHERSAGDVAFDLFAPPVGSVQYYLLVFSLAGQPGTNGSFELLDKQADVQIQLGILLVPHRL